MNQSLFKANPSNRPAKPSFLPSQFYFALKKSLEGEWDPEHFGTFYKA
jgi:hypothetical protein